MVAGRRCTCKIQHRMHSKQLWGALGARDMAISVVGHPSWVSNIGYHGFPILDNLGFPILGNHGFPISDNHLFPILEHHVFPILIGLH